MSPTRYSAPFACFAFLDGKEKQGVIIPTGLYGVDESQVLQAIHLHNSPMKNTPAAPIFYREQNEGP